MIKLKFWVYSGLVVLLVGANFHYTAKQFDAAIRADADVDLREGEKRFRAANDEAGRRTVALAAAAATHERVVSTLVRAMNAGEIPSADDVEAARAPLARQIADQGSAPQSVVLLANSKGATRQLTGREVDYAVDTSGLGLVTEALGGEARAGVAEIDGSLMRVAAAPVRDAGGRLLGAVLLGFPLDDAALADLRAAAGVGVTLLLGERVMGSTNPAAADPVAKVAPSAPVGKAFAWGRTPATPILQATRAVTKVAPIQGYGRKVPLAGAQNAEAVLTADVSAAIAGLETYQLYQAAAAGLLVFLALIWAFFVALGAGAKEARRLATDLAGGTFEPRRYSGAFRNLAEAVLDTGRTGVEGAAAAGVVNEIITGKHADISSVLGPPATPPHDEPEPEAFPFGAGGDDIEPIAAGELMPSVDPPAPPPPPEPAGFDPFEEPAAPAPPPPPDAGAAPGGFDPFATDDAGAQPGAGFDPFGAAGGAAASASPAPAPSSGSDYFSDATRVVNLQEMAAADAATADDPFAAAYASSPADEDDNPDATVVAKVPDALLQATARSPAVPKDPDEDHFREVYDEFVSTRQQCGEADGVNYEKFVGKLRKNRDAIKAKHGARTVRFQVYVKEGKAALKATPVR